MKEIDLSLIFSEEQLKAAYAFRTDHKRLRDEVVMPNMAKINALTQQENNADYWAYLLEWALGKGKYNE